MGVSVEDKFGKLTVVRTVSEKAKESDKKRQIMCYCNCDCGKWMERK